MFTGIVKNIGTIVGKESSGTNLHLWLSRNENESLTIDQSVAHNGICLTIDAIENDRYRVTAIQETIQKTTIKYWNLGDKINTELCLRIGDRLDGHIVQGHVDTTGVCESITEHNGSYDIQFSYPKEFASLVIEKGSICIDGISLTCHQLKDNCFTVSIIPYTWQHTNAHTWKPAGQVNLEFDIIGKYLQRSKTNS